jgi:CBS domain containing-hemolysin-like protein
MTILLKPLVIVSEKISRSLRRDVATPITSAEELRLLAFVGGNEGAVARRTAAMVVGATQLRHLHAADVMLPRDEIDFLSATMNREEAATSIRLSGHSRFPLSASSDLDDVNAVVFAKEVLAWLLDNDANVIDWAALSHEPLIVPESSPLPQLLNTFQDSQQHLAVVVDEYGSVQGIAALEDVLEEIVGDIRDEHDLPADDISVQSDGSLVMRASVDLRSLSARLGLPWDTDLEVSTIGGLITEALERIPVAGDVIDWRGHRIEVLRADRHRARVLSLRQKA